MSLAIPFGAFTAGRLMFRTARYRGIVVGRHGDGLEVRIRHGGNPAFPVHRNAGWACGYVARWYLTMPPCLVAAQSAAPHALVGVATSMTALFRSMGGSVGIAILSSVLFLRLGGIATDAPPGTSPLLAALGGAASQPLREAFGVVFGIAAVAALGALLLAARLPERNLREG